MNPKMPMPRLNERSSGPAPFFHHELHRTKASPRSRLKPFSNLRDFMIYDLSIAWYGVTSGSERSRNFNSHFAILNFQSQQDPTARPKPLPERFPSQHKVTSGSCAVP